MHEEAAEMAKSPDHDAGSTTRCCFGNKSTLDHTVEHHELSETETQERDHVCDSEAAEACRQQPVLRNTEVRVRMWSLQFKTRNCKPDTNAAAPKQLPQDTSPVNHP